MTEIPNEKKKTNMIIYKLNLNIVSNIKDQNQYEKSNIVMIVSIKELCNYISFFNILSNTIQHWCQTLI